MNLRILVFTVVTFTLGIILAIQFHTTQQPVVRDTRDVWQLRTDLDKEKKRHQQLNEEINKYEALLNQYYQSEEADRIETMKKVLKDLKKEAGLIEREGSGIILTIEPLFNMELVGQPLPQLGPQLLTRLINEVNAYQAEAIAVGDERIITTSAIREVNGQTYVNNRPISPFPLKVKVITKNPEKLYNKMVGSQSADDFAKENLSLIPEKKEEIKLPAYEQHVTVKYMKQVKEES
ncbi:DUF881 domain-containing protein [Bacillus taeanensis]|uniref:NgoFVII family restriction endonuclease n=1 Tax=Bacillus taeanensis TaxID=273032 RepID=A0A366XXB2_9BACI|nr:DUF881 domain-containing protein [Bacillus taeanensis]RBW70208.1 hypothetical protein DS031_06430 [Bacillus taeanensis]